MNGAQRRQRQADIQAEFAEDMAQRPAFPPTPVPADTDPAYCSANMRGHRHDFSMKGNDGKRRCWHCCAKKPEPTA